MIFESQNTLECISICSDMEKKCVSELFYVYVEDIVSYTEQRFLQKKTHANKCQFWRDTVKPHISTLVFLYFFQS